MYTHVHPHVYGMYTHRYELNAPGRNTGMHRYIVLLLQQVACTHVHVHVHGHGHPADPCACILDVLQVKPPPTPTALQDFFGRPRHSFDLRGFLQTFEGSMVPRAMSFFHISPASPPHLTRISAAPRLRLGRCRAR